jgi:predicted glycoside hydrolase/deacetylase ChbG (UPF0249 family)
VKSGRAQLNLGNVTSTGALANLDMRTEALKRFGDVPGLHLSTSNPNGWPTFDLTSLTPEGWNKLTEVVDWFIALAKAPPPIVAA